MNREIVEKYADAKGDDHVFVGRDLYNIYAALERYEGRTPITYYNYCAGMDMYIYWIWTFMIRCNWVFNMMYGLGTMRIAVLNEVRNFYALRWRRKERPQQYRIHNQGFYKFKKIEGDVNFGKKAMNVWVKETRYSIDLKGYESFFE